MASAIAKGKQFPPAGILYYAKTQCPLQLVDRNVNLVRGSRLPALQCVPRAALPTRQAARPACVRLLSHLSGLLDAFSSPSSLVFAPAFAAIAAPTYITSPGSAAVEPEPSRGSTALSSASSSTAGCAFCTTFGSNSGSTLGSTSGSALCPALGSALISCVRSAVAASLGYPFRPLSRPCSARQRFCFWSRTSLCFRSWWGATPGLRILLCNLWRSKTRPRVRLVTRNPRGLGV